MEVYEVTSWFTIYYEHLSGRRYRVIFWFVSCLSEPRWIVSDSNMNLELGWKTCGMEPLASVGRKAMESRVAGCGFIRAGWASQQVLLNLPGAGSGLAASLRGQAGLRPACRSPYRDGFQGRVGNGKSRNRSCSSSLSPPDRLPSAGTKVFPSAKEGLGLAQDDCACTWWRSAWELSGGTGGKSHPAILQK